MKAFLVALLFVVIPVTLYAAGIVPCNGPECQACHFVTLGQNLLTWFIKAMTLVIVLIFAWGGVKMVMSAGSSEGVSQAKSMMTNSIVGLLIMLSAWLVVDTVMKLVINNETNTPSKLGVWNEIRCTAQPIYAWSPTETGSRGVSPSSPTSQGLPSAVGAVGSYKNQMCTIAANAGINDCASLLAIMTQESGGNPSAQSSAGAIGLMQVMPAAARSLDPSIKNLSDSEVAQKLLDPTYNMQIATAYYKDVSTKFGSTNYDAIYAAYNGGVGAIQQSSDCPGLQKWQCVWDSPGCYNTSKTDCTKNTGYIETRD